MLLILGHYMNCSADHMHKYLTDWVEVYRYFVENVGGDSIWPKGQNVEDYMFNATSPLGGNRDFIVCTDVQNSHCIILEGKYWCTNQDEVLNRATIYVIY